MSGHTPFERIRRNSQALTRLQDVLGTKYNLQMTAISGMHVLEIKNETGERVFHDQDPDGEQLCDRAVLFILRLESEPMRMSVQNRDLMAEITRLGEDIERQKQVMNRFAARAKVSEKWWKNWLNKEKKRA